MVGLDTRVGQGWRLRWIAVVRRAVCAIAQRYSVIACLKTHAVVTVVGAVRGGQTIRNDMRRGMRGEGGGEWGQVIGLGRLSRLACLPKCSPELFTFAQLVFETSIVLPEVPGLLAGLATGVLELKDDGLEGGDWEGDDERGEGDGKGGEC